MQLKANEELELRVLDRTAELKRAMENVELANVQLAKLSVTDGLTKVHNRRFFDETLKKEHDRSARTGTPLALLLADIDHFKKINDSVGHLAGDECLKLVASTLAGTVGRSTDLVARYGGEEFAIVLPATDAAARARSGRAPAQGGRRHPVHLPRPAHPHQHQPGGGGAGGRRRTSRWPISCRRPTRPCMPPRALVATRRNWQRTAEGRASAASDRSCNASGAGFAGPPGGVPWGQERSDWGANVPSGRRP